MIFGQVDFKDFSKIQGYMSEHYPMTSEVISRFRLSNAPEMTQILKSLASGEQITFHAFPGVSLISNAYIFPRFLRVEAKGNEEFVVTREKSIRERHPALMATEDVIKYYFEIADMAFLQAELEISWNERWPTKRIN